MKKNAITKVIIGILAVAIIYIGTRAAYYFATSPKQIEANGSTTVYEMVNLVDDFMDSHDINISKGSQEYIDWLNTSLMEQLDKDVNDDLKNQKWYSDYKTYATCYLNEEQTMEHNSIKEFFGYNIVVPKNMRDKTIHQLEEYLPK